MADYTDRSPEYPDVPTERPIAPIAPFGPIGLQATEARHGASRTNGELSGAVTSGADVGNGLATATSVALATRNGLSSDLPVLRIGWEPYQPTAWPAPWRFLVAIPTALMIVVLAAGSAFMISSKQPAIREARAEVRLQAPPMPTPPRRTGRSTPLPRRR